MTSDYTTALEYANAVQLPGHIIATHGHGTKAEYIEIPTTQANTGTDFVLIETQDDQSYFWSREWQQAEAEASEDIAQGQVRGFDDVEDLIAELNDDDEA